MGQTRGSRPSNPPPSRGGLVCSYIEQNLVHSSGDFYGRPFRLTPEQRQFIWRAYELRPDGRRRYRRVLRGRPKGAGKTELAAAIGCVELALAGQHGFPDAPEIPVAAASFDQADLLFGAAKAMIAEGPLAPFFECFDTEILRVDGPGRMFRVAAQAGTNDGLRPTFFLADALHEWTGGKERVHLVIENGLAKRRDAWSLGISTAGSDKDTLLGHLYDHGRRIEAGARCHCRHARGPRSTSFLLGWTRPICFRPSGEVRSIWRTSAAASGRQRSRPQGSASPRGSTTCARRSPRMPSPPGSRSLSWRG